jgi:hypothetical protein
LPRLIPEEQLVKLQAPAARRNSAGILHIIEKVFPRDGLVLEVASGSGYHAVQFSRALPAVRWQPSDPSPDARASIREWARDEGGANLLEPIALDVRSEPWPVTAADAILCANMVHISPWSCTQALFRGAGEILSSGDPLVLYGPYRVRGEDVAPSNAAFDESLRSRNPEWGIRELGEVREVAKERGFALAERHEMAANNLTLVFRKS